MVYKTGIERADEFNAAHPIGTPVRYWPGFREGEGVESVTRTPAWSNLAGDPMVSVEGYGGGIYLTHVDPVATPSDASTGDHRG